MRKIVLLILSVIFLQSCQFRYEKEYIVNPESTVYTSVGKQMSPKDFISAEEMHERYDQLAIGDTLDVKFKAAVASVCKNKGCWMNLALPSGEEAAVKFKDYAFFVPKDIENKEVVVNGKAFVSMVSVEEQRHYAEDAGKSEKEIAHITEPKRTLSFLADGVLIEE